jgi:hypothetical protein
MTEVDIEKFAPDRVPSRVVLELDVAQSPAT